MSKAIQFEDNGENIYPIVTERVENENGTALKFSDGTMICYGNKSFPNLNFDTQYGNIYHANTQTLTFAQSFTNIPSVEVMPVSFGGGIGGVSGTGIDARKIEVYIWHAIEYTLSVTVSYIAIGRWKQLK